jgi:hypothetical protein
MKTIEDAVVDLHRAMLTDDIEALDAFPGHLGISERINV